MISLKEFIKNLDSTAIYTYSLADLILGGLL